MFKQMSQNGNFAFSRFNDGEIIAMCNESGVTARGDQEISKSLKENLIRCAQYEKENYWKGIPCSKCFPKHREIADKIIGNYPQKCLATAFVNHNWKQFLADFPIFIDDREVIFISGDDQDPSRLWFLGINVDLHFSIPNKNSWNYYKEVVNHPKLISKFSNDKTVVLLSCGPLSRILCCDWFSKYDCTFLDIGSCFDPFTRNVWHRFHLGKLDYCSECNSI